jgi:hypothetical protein
MQDHLPLMRTSERRDVAPRQAGPCLAGDNRDEIPVQRAGVIQRICDIVVAECKTIFGHRMISLVLTGSAARGEATIGKTEEGWKLSGDVEFLVVVGRTSERADSRAVAQIKQQAAKKLRTQGVDVAIDIAVATPSYFQALPPHIFSNELRSCGKIVAGDLTVLGLIPKIAAQEISREDAWRLLCNRMIEQLSFVNDLENSTTELTPRLHYATVKLYLDMATSYLVFTGHYAPTYQERAVRLTALAAQSKERAPFPLAKFASRVVECTSWKLSGDEETCNRSIEFWHEGISYMRRLWRWEMIQMTEGTSELTIASLSRRFAKQQTLKQRFRGWISVVKRDGWLKSYPRWPRWMKLATRSTPRYLVYQAAAEIAFRLPCLVKHSGQPPRLDLNWRAVRDLLPGRAPKTKSQKKDVWRTVIDEVLWNYSQFLRNTRA